MNLEASVCPDLEASVYPDLDASVFAETVFSEYTADPCVADEVYPAPPAPTLAVPLDPLVGYLPSSSTEEEFLDISTEANVASPLILAKNAMEKVN